ncbi:hypothetical protein MLD38_011466 [Melastoma candidum]|uniref:Uncharacterized protein n=1 Tax=Melastoma candidum TaxID=119954 RepID=A0ACB9R2S4_9MYRT|nr:hypothetical protein MLD38_011466 [Melastoma candidum]
MPIINLTHNFSSDHALQDWFKHLYPSERGFVSTKVRSLVDLIDIELDLGFLRNLLEKWNANSFKFGDFELSPTLEEYIQLARHPTFPKPGPPIIPEFGFPGFPKIVLPGFPKLKVPGEPGIVQEPQPSEVPTCPEIPEASQALEESLIPEFPHHHLETEEAKVLNNPKVQESPKLPPIPESKNPNAKTPQPYTTSLGSGPDTLFHLMLKH